MVVNNNSQKLIESGPYNQQLLKNAFTSEWRHSRGVVTNNFACIHDEMLTV